MITYTAFKKKFKRYHICGAEVLGMALTYDSRCPQCNPDSPQWEDECLRTYQEGRMVRIIGRWIKE